MTEQIPAPAPSLSRLVWRLVLVLLAVGFLVTLRAVLRGQMSDTELKVMLSSFLGALFSSLGLVCADAVQRAPLRLGGWVGTLAAVAGVALVLTGIWLELARYTWWWRAFGVSFVLSTFGAHACALLRAQLAGRWEPVRLVTRIAVWGLAIVLSFMIVSGRGDAALGRLLSVLFTIAVFGTLAMPVLARLSRPDVTPPGAAPSADAPASSGTGTHTPGRDADSTDA